MDQPKYAERNAVVLGVSLDSVDSHKKFCAQQGLTFKLLADADHKVTDSYGSLNNFAVLKFAARNTFLIDPNGRVAKTFLGVNPLSHSAQVLSQLEAFEKSAAVSQGTAWVAAPAFCPRVNYGHGDGSAE